MILYHNSSKPWLTAKIGTVTVLNPQRGLSSKHIAANINNWERLRIISEMFQSEGRFWNLFLYIKENLLGELELKADTPPFLLCRKNVSLFDQTKCKQK